MMLADALPAQSFMPNRVAYLGKHVTAMEMLCRKLSGEHFSLIEEVGFCLDIHLEWTPEEELEKAHALYEMVLPGRGNLAERLQAHRTELAYPIEHLNDFARYIDHAYAEARKRTSSFVELPSDEAIDIQYLPEWEHAAAAYYRNQGYIEQSICLTLCPQCVIQAGIAMLAHDMIFAEGEAEQWLVEHVYRPLHKDVDATGS